LKQTDKMKPDTEQIIDDLKAWIPLSSPLDKILNRAADRLEELQEDYMSLTRLSDKELKRLVKERDQAQAEIMRLQAGFEVHSKFAKERDEARAEVERLKTELHDTIDSYKLNNLQPKTTRPDPSRLEIAAMLKAGWFANRDADFNATDYKWWIEQADALIAAAREVAK